MAYEGGEKKVKCAYPGCKNTFDNFAYGHIQAHQRGWFSQFNGDHWCPNHIPDWVEEWRARKAAKIEWANKKLGKAGE